MMRTLAIVAAMATAGAAQQYPTIAGDWNAFVSQVLVQYQGSYNLPNGDYCCGSLSNCQVQIQSQVGPMFYSVNNQAVASMNTDGTGIISLFNSSILMEVSVDANMNCQQYCPIDPSEAPLTAYSVVNTTDVGASVIRGIKCEGWQDVDVGPFNITMETDTVYVNQADFNNAAFVFENDQLTPFGEAIGVSNTTYTGWKSAPQAASLFAVKGLSTCQQAQGCNQNNERLLHRRMIAKSYFWRTYLKGQAEEKNQYML